MAASASPLVRRGRSILANSLAGEEEEPSSSAPRLPPPDVGEEDAAAPVFLFLPAAPGEANAPAAGAPAAPPAPAPPADAVSSAGRSPSDARCVLICGSMTVWRGSKSFMDRLRPTTSGCSPSPPSGCFCLLGVGRLFPTEIVYS